MAILEQITQESGVALVALEVRPLPPVPRCSYHMIDHEKSRCYLLARFKLQNGDQRYLLEIDTSDNRKTMSTRIMGFKAGVEAGKCIDRILRETVKGSLRWPGTMAKYCEPLHSVHHPKESSPGANHARVFADQQRTCAAQADCRIHRSSAAIHRPGHCVPASRNCPGAMPKTI